MAGASGRKRGARPAASGYFASNRSNHVVVTAVTAVTAVASNGPSGRKRAQARRKYSRKRRPALGPQGQRVNEMRHMAVAGNEGV